MLKEKLEQYLFNSAYEINNLLENNLLLTNKNEIINRNDYCYILKNENEIGNYFLIQIPQSKSRYSIIIYAIWF